MTVVSLDHLGVYESGCNWKKHPWTRTIVSDRDVYESINVQKRKTIFGTSFIKVGEVDAYSPLPVFLFNYHHASKPFRVLEWSQLWKSFDFFIDHEITVYSELSSSLLYWLVFGVDIKLTENHPWVNSWHITVRPCKTILVSFKEID